MSPTLLFAPPQPEVIVKLQNTTKALLDKDVILFCVSKESLHIFSLQSVVYSGSQLDGPDEKLSKSQSTTISPEICPCPPA